MDLYLQEMQEIHEELLIFRRKTERMIPFRITSMLIRVGLLLGVRTHKRLGGPPRPFLTFGNEDGDDVYMAWKINSDDSSAGEMTS